MVRRAVGIVGALAALAVAGGLSVPAARASAARAFVDRLSVTTTAVTRPLPANFLGLALEYNSVPAWAGTRGGAPVDPILVQLIRNLDPVGRPMLRIGGQSTDRTWWPVPGMAQPVGVTYRLGPGWVAAALALAQATNAQLILGVNLEANRPRISAYEALQLLGGLGSRYIGALEIGNEPDLYTLIPWYKKLHGTIVPWYIRQGRPVYSRRRSYGPKQFIGEFTRTLRALQPWAPLPIAGPETGSTPWMQAFDRFLAPKSSVRMLTSHDYGLNQCITDPRSPQYPSVPNLLAPAASRGELGDIGPFVALAHRYGASYRIDEMGSISCNGRAGVSNAMASSLWVLDSLFEIDADGVDGVNLHTYPNSVNGLFDLKLVDGHWQAVVHPLYYGALMFAQAAPAGSELLQTRSTRRSPVRAWATRGPDGRVRVVLLNDSLTRSGTAVVTVPGAAGPAAIERLQAPSAYATDGITLGGQTFGETTLTGTLPAPVPAAVDARAGSYTVSLGPAGAALLTLPAPRAAARHKST